MSVEALDGIPDTPLGRAYRTVCTIGSEMGATVSHESIVAGEAERRGTEEVAERRYHVEAEDMAGFASGIAGWVLRVPHLTTEQRLQMAIVNGLLTGIQFERDRLAERRREQRS